MPKAKLTTRERTTSNVSSDNLNKGSELSFAEADSNFINLRDASFGIADDSSTVLQVTDDKTITIAGGTNVTTSLSGDTLTIAASVTTTNFGDLTATGSTISAPSNADLTLATSGTGDVVSSGNHKITGDLEVDVIRPEAAGNDIHILGLDDTIANRSYVKVEGGAQAGVWIKGAAEIAMDHADSIGSGGVFHSNETQTHFNKGKNDIQNFIIRHHQSTDSSGQTTSAIFHVETYADRGRTNGNGMVTIGDSGMAQAGSPSMIQGQGTENFNVFGTARLNNVFFTDNKIYTDRSNEDLELECSGTGTIDLKLPTSSTIGSNGGASALTANPVGYVKVKINGTEYQIPYYNV